MMALWPVELQGRKILLTTSQLLLGYRCASGLTLNLGVPTPYLLGKWSGRLSSNQQPSDYDSAAPPVELRPD